MEGFVDALGRTFAIDAPNARRRFPAHPKADKRHEGANAGQRQREGAWTRFKVGARRLLRVVHHSRGRSDGVPLLHLGGTG